MIWDLIPMFLIRMECSKLREDAEDNGYETVVGRHAFLDATVPELVCVTEVFTPGEFFVRKVDFTQQLDSLSIDLENCVKVPHTTIEVGGLYIADCDEECMRVKV